MASALGYDYLRCSRKSICWWIKDAEPFALVLDVWVVRHAR